MPTLMHFVWRHGHDGDHMAAHYVHFPFLFKLKGACSLQPPNTNDIQEKKNIMMLN